MPKQILTGDFSPEGYFVLEAFADASEAIARVARGFAQVLAEMDCDAVVLAFDHTKDWSRFLAAAGEALTAGKTRGIVLERPAALPVVAHGCRLSGAGALHFCSSPLASRCVGIRFLLPDGSPAPESVAEKIQRAASDAPATSGGASLIRAEFLPSYMEWARKLVGASSLRKMHLRLLVDACGGLGDRVLEALLGAALDRLHTIYGLPLPNFFHRTPIPMPKEARELGAQVQRGRWSGGILLSGDASGLGLVDRNGDWVPLVAALRRVAEETGLVLECLDPLDSSWLRSTPRQPEGTSSESDGSRVVLGSRGRLRWPGLAPAWDGLLSVGILLGQAGSRLFDPCPDVPFEAQEIIRSDRGPLPSALEIAEDLEIGAAKLDAPTVRTSAYLGQTRGLYLSWNDRNAWASVEWGEGQEALLVRVLGSERGTAQRISTSLTSFLAARLGH
jgi:hypothetical protein